MGVVAAQSRAAEFREILTQRAVAADGAMGTMLLAKGVLPHRSLDELSLSLPALVRDVHQEYLRAGAELLRTNTFGANRKRLEAFGFGDKVRLVNRAAARIAREAAREQAFVAGCVGPLGMHLAPLGPLSPEQARALFRQQMDALVESGVDLLTLETFGDLKELREAVLAAREAAPAEMVVAAHVSVENDGLLADGSTMEDVARALNDLPVDVAGVNCCSGPAAVLEALEKISAFTAKPLGAFPAAGVGLACSPAYLARQARRFLRLGAKLVGGCCGSTPEHVRAIRAEARDFVPADSGARAIAVEPASRPPVFDPVPLAQRSDLGAMLAQGRFVNVREIEPARGADFSRELGCARGMKEGGADALVVGGRPGAKSATSICLAIRQQAGIEAILKILKRRSPREVQTLLLGAHALGVNNIVSPRPMVIRIAANLNQGLDLGGHPLGSQTRFVIAAQIAADQDLEAYRGADFLIASATFEDQAVDGLLDRARDRGIPVLATIRSLAGMRDAEFLINEHHLAIPPAVIARLNQDDSAAARTEGEAIAQERLDRLRSRVAGVVWSTARRVPPER